jgi:hypothetical protein
VKLVLPPISSACGFVCLSLSLFLSLARLCSYDPMGMLVSVIQRLRVLIYCINGRLLLFFIICIQIHFFGRFLVSESFGSLDLFGFCGYDFDLHIGSTND